MFVGSFICLILMIWMLTRIWKQSAGLAIVSLVFWPALIFAVIKYWGDDESDIKLPFLLFVPASIYTIYQMNQYASALRQDQDSLLSLLTLFA